MNELATHFDEVRLLTNKRDIDVIADFKENVHLHFEKNEGYDFGMFYKFAITKRLNTYSEITIVNDSNILINNLENVFKDGRKQDVDFWGLIDSNEKPWFSTHENNYHVQSHFIVLNESAIKALSIFLDYFDVDSVFKEENQKALRRAIINKWEIGFSQHLLKAGLKSYTYIKTANDYAKNLAHIKPKELINQGYPLLKKKVFYDLSSKQRVEWENLLKAKIPKEWKSDLVIKELERNRSLVKKSFLKRILPFK
ncbi:rhamnan synthesis F family protein [uncultured Arcticibacterium sp.]|uniref:rhamnan synthesis F family protein n=1 Tax=uncultured Arcticibacterium sp. TaxID=2173042 RepID=UPI0030FC8FFD